MKTTITINLGGIVFHIDDDAYEMLHMYLMKIEKQFVDEEEAKEVMSDIEVRLAELFKETLGTKRDVIMKEDISTVMKIMGQPEDFLDSDTMQEEEPQRKASNKKAIRRLYRDPDNRYLGGVSGGLGAYFNTDPLLFRIAFVLLVFPGGVGVIIYLILWIAIPEATTTAQKLEMRGEPITLENIKKAVRDEFENVKKNMKF